MKIKRVVAILLAIALLVAIVPTSVLAADNPGTVDKYTFQLVGKAQTLTDPDSGDATPGLVFDIQANTSGYDLAAFALALEYDSTVLSPSDSTGFALKSGGAWLEGANRACEGRGNVIASGAGMVSLSDTRGGLKINLNAATDDFVVSREFKTIGKIYFVFKDEKSTANLTKSSVKLTTKENIGTGATQISVVDLVMFGDGTQSHQYGTVDPSKTDDMLANQFQIVYDGIEVPGAPLDTITLSAGTSSTTVPTAADNKTNTIEVTAAGMDTDGSAVSPLKEVTYKLYTDEACTTEVQKDKGISIAEKSAGDGATISVTKDASQILADNANKLYVVANKSGKTSDKLEVTITKTPAAVQTVTIAGGADISIPLAGANKNEKDVTATVVDQYGYAMSGVEVTFTLPTTTGVSLSANKANTNAQGKATVKIQVDSTAANNSSATVTAAAGGKTTATGTTFQFKSLPDVTVTDRNPADPLVLGYDAVGKTVSAAITNANTFAAKYFSAPTSDWTIKNGSDTLVWGENEVTLTASATGYSPVDKTVKVYVKKALTAADIEVADKVYDGKTTGTASQVTIKDASKGGKTVEIGAATVTYANANVGNPTVTITGLTLSGADKDLFTIGNITTTGKITPAEAALEGKTSGTAPLDGWNLNHIVTSDKVSLAGIALKAKADDPAVYEAEGITVTFATADGSEITKLVADVPYTVTVEVTAPVAMGNYTLKVDTYTSKVTFTENTFTVTYDAGTNGVPSGKSTEVVPEGASPVSVPGITAKEGYTFKGWRLDGKTLTVDEVKALKITKDITLTAVYEAQKKVTYINGFDDGKFYPEKKARRAEVAKMLAMLSKDFDENGKYTSKLTDLTADWYKPYVNFCAEKNIVNGYEDGSFKPEQSITRGEFAKMLVSYMNLEASTVKGSSFSDVNGHWAAGYIQTLKDKKIVEGRGDGTFDPDGLLTRQEAVKMINLALNVKYDAASCTVTFPDVTNANWGYQYIMAALNTDVQDIINK